MTVPIRTRDLANDHSAIDPLVRSDAATAPFRLVITSYLYLLKKISFESDSNRRPEDLRAPALTD
jgi:hypothetical protein